MKKKRILALSVVSMLAILASCGKDGEDTPVNPDGTTTISFFGWGSIQEQRNFSTLVAAFMEENPDIKVVYSATDASTYITTLDNKGNNLPDVFYVPDYEFMSFADSGKLLALDSYLTAEELDSMWALSTKMHRYDRSKLKLGQGKLFGLPKDLGPYPLVYNKTLLRSIIEEKNLDIGLPDPENPMTWADFREYLKQITGTFNGKKVFGIGYYELMCAVYSNNADFWDADVKKEKISDQNFIDALQFVADLTLVDKTAPTADDQSSMNSFTRFLNNGCVFTFMGPWDCTQFWEDLTCEFDIVPPPVGPAEGAKSTAWVGSVAYAVSAKSKNKEAAVRLAKWLATSESSNRLNYQIGQAIPNIKSMAEGDYINGVGLEGRKLLPANRKLFVDIVKGTDKVQGKNRARYFLYDNTPFDDLNDNLLPVFTGEQSAASFVNSYKGKYQKALDENNEYLNG